MSWEKMDTHCVAGNVQHKVSQRTTSQVIPPTALMNEAACNLLSLPVLAALCLKEIDKYRRGEPCMERYVLELLHRATIQNDQEVLVWVKRCFEEMVQGWVRCHPQREVAFRLECEENYVSQAFEGFWRATSSKQQVEFKTLADALQYLRASVNGAILDALRANQRPREVSLPVSGAAGELSVEYETFSSELRDILNGLLSNPHERRLAYLLFYCGLKPREVVPYCSPEWNSVQEIYVQRRTMMERVFSHRDALGWELK